MSNSKDQLKHAYKLIKRDRTDEARAIIRPILESEPDNAQAWWLLAHTVDDPSEVRTALNKMLALDPRDSNAPKARELLAMLDKQYPATGFEDMEILPIFAASEAPTGDVFAGGDFEALRDEMFPDLEEPGGSEKPEPAGVSFDIPQMRPESDVDIAKLFEFPTEGLDDEAKAKLEEKAGRRAGGGRRLRRVLIFILLFPLVLVAALFVLTSGGSSEKRDPGALAAVQVQSDQVSQAMSAAESDLSSADLGSEKHVTVAQSSLGSTLFIEFCSQPTSDLPGLIAQGMAIAARQAPAVTDVLAAVGVSVNLCNGTAHDTLYRASTPVNEAVRFLNGEFGEGDNGLAGFQATWKTS